ncbi:MULTISPECIES: winged helix-turn-helix domain-containing protein [unclassified Gordonia (in: high G+C Gram-positive bacteria)]|uniref:winged helix-turn-helix domain-containing protein n=1 Tax=unclassified Gordonia (in: high G+C Gram-positive bacteria) TaxID=2657482 RepID=UPI001FFED3DF|nr:MULTISPECIES: crosslink repair DNA glycosylase YcaQ family protein [unclassified Gordonia (in: high G+C Gram-positive bacteria)]UQE73364.1 winged helix DNA-binding domain-containing protein [Gordonia sp. PP30]
MTIELSPAQARRIALAAQGFADPVPTGPPTRAHLRRVLGRTRLLQMDSVNVLARAHYLPAFSRLGPYDDALLDRAAWRSTARAPRLLAEYWAHEAALIPVDDWPLFRWRMREYAEGRWRHTREVLARNGSLADDVVAVIAEAGPSTPRRLEEALGIERPSSQKGSWWVRGEVKHLCEALFAGGRLSAVRDDQFSRHYDLTERVIDPGVLAQRICDDDARRELVRRAAAAHGIATVADLADYYRLKTAQVRGVLGDLIDDGTVTEVSVRGWADPAYLHRDARRPRRVRRSALLSPFDPLVFFRPRTERLFDFHYRIEIYVPEHKRVHGYYVLPYLLDGELVARVDLKADRKSGVLHVLSAHREPGADAGPVAETLAGDLRAMADWRGLGDVVVHPRGDLSGPLAVAAAR